MASVVRGGSPLLTTPSSSLCQSPCSVPYNLSLVSRANRVLSGGLGIVSLGMLPQTRSTSGLSSKGYGLPQKLDKKQLYDSNIGGGVIRAKKGNPPIMPAVMTPGTVLYSSGSHSIHSNCEIPDLCLIYINCPGGSTYSVLGIYDCMSWIKPKVGTVCFGVAATQGALLLAGGEKGMRNIPPLPHFEDGQI